MRRYFLFPVVITLIYCLIFSIIHNSIYKYDSSSYNSTKEMKRQNMMDSTNDLIKVFRDIFIINKKLYYFNMFLTSPDLHNNEKLKCEYQQKCEFETVVNGIKFVFWSHDKTEIVHDSALKKEKMIVISQSFLKVFEKNDQTDNFFKKESFSLGKGGVIDVVTLRKKIENEVKNLKKSFYGLRDEIENSEKEISFFQFFYFVVVTSTTLGFGDITPISKIAQFFTMINAITGLVLFAFIGSFLFNELKDWIRFRENLIKSP